MQLRDRIGRFAGKQNTAKLRKPDQSFARQKSCKKRSRKKPLLERNFFGRVGAVLNGDYAKWKRRQAKANFRMEFGIEKPKPRKRKRRSPAPIPKRKLFGLF